MLIQQQITQKVTTQLLPEHLEVINESHMHNVPPGSESHFKLVVVTEQFQEKNRLARHRMVNEVLAQELQNSIHALALRLFTPDEWKTKNGHVAPSPQCKGGSKADQ